jgi:hypothetical protein
MGTLRLREERVGEDVSRALGRCRVHHHRHHGLHHRRVHRLLRHHHLRHLLLLLLRHDRRAHRRVLRGAHATQRCGPHRRLLRLHQPRRLRLRILLRAYRLRHR